MNTSRTARKAPGRLQGSRTKRPAPRGRRHAIIGLSEPGERIRGDALKARLMELVPTIATMASWGADLSNVEVKLRVRRRPPWATSGSSDPATRRITMLLGNNEAEAIGYLIHEFAHCAMFRRGWTEEGHGVRFANFERAAFEEYLGERLDVKAKDAQAYGGSGLRHHRYAQLGAFVRQLAARLNEQRKAA